jgi:D-arabinose 1-dehydrogenase-like Zn-dependent alcohol dehydrogenase
VRLQCGKLRHLAAIRRVAETFLLSVYGNKKGVTMKVAVYKGVKSIKIEERPTPHAGGCEAIVKVKYCGICGSDVHGYLGGLWPPDTIFGHEFVGVVAEVGNAATG